MGNTEEDSSVLYMYYAKRPPAIHSFIQFTYQIGSQ